MILLSVAGIVLAGYLTWVHFDTDALVCGLGDCHTVQASEFATVGPAPVAVLGLGMYLAILACILAGRLRPALQFPATMVAFGIALAGSLYAAYLTWIEVAVIDAICQWCVVSAIVTVVLTLLLAAELLRGLEEPIVQETETGRQHGAS